MIKLDILINLFPTYRKLTVNDRNITNSVYSHETTTTVYYNTEILSNDIVAVRAIEYIYKHKNISVICYPITEDTWICEDIEFLEFCILSGGHLPQGRQGQI